MTHFPTAIAPSSPRPAPLTFRNLFGADDDYEGECSMWIHPEPIASDGPVWLMIRLLDFKDATGGETIGPHKHRWLATLSAVSPFFATDEAICAALRSCGTDWLEERWDDMSQEARLHTLCELLVSYGAAATLYESSSNRASGAWKGAATEATLAKSLFGFYVDRQQNLVGESGWDFLRCGWAGHREKPDPMAAKAIAWLNETYEGRVEFRANEE